MSIFDDLPPGPVTPLTCTRTNGKPYVRSASVEQQIGGMLGIPQSEWAPKLRHAHHETLIHLIRVARRQGMQIYGELFTELAGRTARLAEQWSRGLPAAEKEEVVDQVLCETMELAVSLESNRQTEFLEVAFVKAVQLRTVVKFRTFQRALRRHDPVIPEQYSQDEEQAGHLLESVPDQCADPETIAVMRELLTIAESAVENKEDVEITYLHFVEGWPIADVCRRFNITKGEIDYRMLRTKAAMKEALEARGIHGMADILSSRRIGSKKSAVGGTK